MTEKKIQEIMDNYRDIPLERKPIIDTGRKGYPLSKFPVDLDFSKTVGGTTYTVCSHFDPNAEECLFAKIRRMMFGDPNLCDDDYEDDYDD